MNNKYLIASVHDVSPRDFDRLREIDRFYRAIGIGAKYAMLVVPNFNRSWRLDRHTDFLTWLRERAQAGVEIMLHGYYHFDTTPRSKRSLLTQIKHQLLGEGEFAAISERQAMRRIWVGSAVLARALGKPVQSFVAPAWQYSAGAQKALCKAGFQIAESRASVWSPAMGRTFSNTPVIAYSNRSALRRASSIAWSQIAETAMRRRAVIRHAIHPADFDNSELKNEIARSLSSLLADREIASYRELFAPARGALFDDEPFVEGE